MTICIERQKELLAEQAVVARNEVCIYGAENGSREINVNTSSGRGVFPPGDEILPAAGVTLAFWGHSFTTALTKNGFWNFINLGEMSLSIRNLEMAFESHAKPEQNPRSGVTQKCSCNLGSPCAARAKS